MKKVNRRFGSIEEYRAEIEKAAIIINGTECKATRIRWRKYRMRLEKELYSLMEVQNEQRETKGMAKEL